MVPVDDVMLASCAELGAGLDLQAAVYGPAHVVDDAFVDTTPAYYRFLAGLVRATGARRIAELGTHFGGSIQALIAGVRDDLRAQAQVATVDVTALNRERLDAIAGLQCVQGDALDDDIIRTMMAAFDDHVDVLFVDTIHSYQQTMENTAVYANRLKPALIVFDDIHLNPEMERFWATVGRLGAGDRHDVTALSDRGSAGLGLLVCRYPFQWPEASTRMRAVKRAAFGARLKVAGALGAETKDRLRKLIGQATRK
jgi:predicted O-methyltransferase YrrM